MNNFAQASPELSSGLFVYQDISKLLPIYQSKVISFDGELKEHINYKKPFFYIENGDLIALCTGNLLLKLKAFKNSILLKTPSQEMLIDNINTVEYLDGIINLLQNKHKAFIPMAVNYSFINLMEDIYEPDDELLTIMLFSDNIIYSKKDGCFFNITCSNEAKTVLKKCTMQEDHYKNGTILYKTPKEDYIDIVKKAKEDIRNGEIFQIVLSQYTLIDSNITPLELFNRLYENNKSDYMIMFNDDEKTVVCASPETLVKVENNTVKTYPIAGTYRINSQTPEEIENKKYQILKDTKELSEHMMLVDLARNDLGRISEAGSVKVEEFLRIKALYNLIHIYSVVSGKLKEKSLLKVLLSTFPAGTLTGAPKIRAMQLIDTYEKTKRGLYGGAIGYFYEGNMDFAIAIRMAVKGNNLNIYKVQTGAGIVHLSNPENEYNECITKSRAILHALGVEIDDSSN